MNADPAALAAALFAVDPWGLGGVCLRSLVQPARDQWLELLRDLVPPAAPIRRVPFNISDERLLGGIDLTATLKANRPVAERGALALADGGIVIVTMAERLSAHTTACLGAVLDSGAVVLPREGVEIRDPARVGIVAMDESMADDEGVPPALLDRLAFLVDLNGFDVRTHLIAPADADDVARARELLASVDISADLVAALCGTAMALGAGSLRVSGLAVRAARALAALDGRTVVSLEDATAAGGLVLSPRASRLPQEAEQEEEQTPVTDELPPDEPHGGPDGGPEAGSADGAAGESPASPDEPPATGDPKLDDVLLEAAKAAIPAGLLERLKSAAARGHSPNAAAGRAGVLRQGGIRGRPSGTRQAAPRGGARLNVGETLRAAAPWQRLRGRTTRDARVRIAGGDLRVTHYQRRSPTLTIFAVDASGSSALNRLAEAKGAVELLLADCYVRRDQVAVVAFRGKAAELLLPPTRSLVRAKRNLAGLPGGGGTPLAAGIDCALRVAEQSLRRGETPIVVLLTDGSANVARNGSGGREGAHADALASARRLTLSGVAALFVDTSPRPNPLAKNLADAMRAEYVPLPLADARSLSRIVGAAVTR